MYQVVHPLSRRSSFFSILLCFHSCILKLNDQLGTTCIWLASQIHSIRGTWNQNWSEVSDFPDQLSNLLAFKEYGGILVHGPVWRALRFKACDAKCPECRAAECFSNCMCKPLNHFFRQAASSEQVTLLEKDACVGV